MPKRFTVPILDTRRISRLLRYRLYRKWNESLEFSRLKQQRDCQNRNVWQKADRHHSQQQHDVHQNVSSNINSISSLDYVTKESREICMR